MRLLLSTSCDEAEGPLTSDVFALVERSLKEKRWDTTETVKFLLKETDAVKKVND